MLSAILLFLMLACGCLASCSALWFLSRLGTGLPVQLVGVGNLGDATNSHLSGKAEASPDIGIGELMQGELAEYLIGPCDFGQEITGCISGNQRETQVLGLLASGLELDLDYQLHASSIDALMDNSNSTATRFLCHLDATVFAL